MNGFVVGNRKFFTFNGAPISMKIPLIPARRSFLYRRILLGRLQSSRPCGGETFPLESRSKRVDSHPEAMTVHGRQGVLCMQ